MTMMMMMVTSL
jgi:hypothetical protein